MITTPSRVCYGDACPAALTARVKTRTAKSRGEHYVLEVAEDFDDEAISRVDLDSEIARALVADFEAIRFAPRPSYSMGLDGTTYELRFGGGMGSLTIQWWLVVPDEWAALRRPLAQLIELAGVDPSEF